MRVQNGHQEETQQKQHLKPGHGGGASPSHSTDSFPLQNKGKTAMKRKSTSMYYGLTDSYMALELSVDKDGHSCGFLEHKELSKEVIKNLYFFLLK